MNPLFCGVNAMAEYLILSYGREASRTIPEIFNAAVDWTSHEWLITNDTCTGPMMYSKKQKEKGQDSDLATHDLEGHYEVFEQMKRAAGLEYIDKATHFRLYGAMYGDQYGALDEEKERLGRWLGEKGNNANSTCKNHYLRNLPIGGLLAMAARQASFRGNAYHCARETTLDIGDLDAVENDSDFYPVLQHLMPGWLDLATRAKRALEYNPIVDTDPISLSNAAFTRLVVAATIAWVQDAVLLTEDIPELFSRAPFSYLLHPDIMTYWNNVKDRVKKSVEEGDRVHHEANLERHDVLNYIRSCNISSTNRLVNEVTSRTCNLMLQQQQNLQQREIDFHLQEIS